MLYLHITVRIYNVYNYILIIDIKMLFASNETEVTVKQYARCLSQWRHVIALSLNVGHH